MGHAFHCRVHDPQVENILLGQMLKVGQRRVVRCHEEGVVELVCQRPFQVSEATEVNDPAPVIAFALPSDFDGAVVAVDPTAMTVVFPLAMTARVSGQSFGDSGGHATTSRHDSASAYSVGSVTPARSNASNLSTQVAHRPQ